MSKEGTKKKWLILLLPLLLFVLGLCYCIKVTVSSGELAYRLKAEGADTIQLDGDVKVDKPLVVNGQKTITGNGTIILVGELDGKFPAKNKKNNSWGMGCTKLDIEDTEAMAAILNVSDGAELTVDGSVKVNAADKANAIRVADGGKLTVDGKAIIENGRYANITVNAKAEADIKGGNVRSAKVYGIVNAGTLNISGGMLSGAATGAVVYNIGTAVQSGGTIEKAGVHNVYVAKGTFTMTGGEVSGAAKDGIVVQEGALAEVKDGKISNCVHGLCNNGTLKAGKITLKEAGIMNYKSGALELNKTTVDTAAVYCLANNGGKVTAKGFTAKGCDTCSIYNFSGDMELVDVTVTKSRDGNIANGGGNMTVKGGKLEKCRDKSVVVGGGKAVFEDVTIAGTSREKYGVYVYGGEFYITDAEVYDISSTAFKVDTGGYIEAKNVNMKEIAQIGFQADGGKIVAENVTMKDLGSHAIYNMEGDIQITGAKIDAVEKNAIQQRGGNTTLSNVEADHIGNHAAYIALGKVTVTDSSFQNMNGNGFYLIEGENEAILKNVVLDGVKKQGVNNQSKMTIDGLTVKNAVQNGIFNKEKGVITAKRVEISGVGEHGINNYNKMSLTDAKISNTGKGSNGLQNKGSLTVEQVSVTGSKNHGAYNTGTVKGSGLTIKNAAKNGVYNNKGTFSVAKVTVDGAGEHGLNNSADMNVSEVTVKGTGKEKNSVQNVGILSLSKATLTGSKNHGIYNTGTVSGKNVTVENAAENGVYNAKGKIDAINGLVVNKTGSHGINNEAAMSVSNLTVKNTGSGKNNIQNAGTLTVTNAAVSGSKNHGIYNTGTISGKDVIVKDAARNGIYNFNGTVTAAGLTVNGVGEHGISNDGTMKISAADISATGAGKNGIQNKGTLTTNGVKIAGSKNHGIYNAGTLTAKGTTKVINSKVNAVYNYQGKLTAEAVTVETTGEHGVNNAAVLEIAEMTVTNAGQNAIQNSGDMRVSKGAVLKDSGKHGIYNGDTFYGKNISINSAGDLALSNGGEMEVHGLETAGAAHKAIYNSGYAELYKATIDGTGVANSGEEYLVDNNGGVLDLTDTTLKNARGTALHNRGKAATSVTNVVINTAGNYGTFVENGSSLSGDGLEINNITKGIDGAEGIAVKNAGKISMLDHVTIGADDPEVTGNASQVDTTLKEIGNNALVNDVTTASYSGYDLTVNNTAGGCAFYNKGILYVTDFAADKPKDGIVSRYSGWAFLSGNIALTNVARNPINTYGPEVKSYRNGVDLTSGSTMTIDGAASHGISNRGSFLAAADSNLVVKNVTGTNVNAINNNAGTMTLGNVTVDNVRVAVSMYNDTTINTNSGNAIQTSGSLTVNGAVVISNIYTKPANNKKDNSNGSGVVVKNGGSISGGGSITINGNGNDGDYSGLYNGIFTTKCAIDLAGDILVDTTANQGIYVADANARVSAVNITIHNAGLNALLVNNASGQVKATGVIKTTSPVKGRGINNSGTIEAGGIEVSGVKDYAGIENNKMITVKGDVKAEQITNGPGIRNKGTMTVNGTTTIKEISGTNTNGIQQDGGKTLNLNRLVIENVFSNSTNSTYGNGIYTKGAIYAADVMVKNTKNIGIFMEGGAVLQADTVAVDETQNQSVQLNHANTLTVGTMTLTNTPKNGLRLYNNSGNPTVTIGTLITKNCTEYGVAAQKAITSSSLNITLLQYFNCGASKNNQVIHGNIKSGIGLQEVLTQ